MSINVTWQPGMTLEDLEKRVIQSACKVFPTQEMCANALGISVRTIQLKLEKYQKEKEEKEAHRKVNPTRSDKIDAENRRLSSERTKTRFRVESDVEAAKKLGVPLHERKKVQKLLPAKDAAGTTESGKTEGDEKSDGAGGAQGQESDPQGQACV